VLDTPPIGDPEQVVEYERLTGEGAFRAQVREVAIGDNLSNTVVCHGDSLFGQGGECGQQTADTVGKAWVVLHIGFACQMGIECRGVAVDKDALHRVMGDPARLNGVGDGVDGERSVDLLVTVGMWCGGADVPPPRPLCAYLSPTTIESGPARCST
jgi:hypothetical protein